MARAEAHDDWPRTVAEPANWQELRSQWEYADAVNAVLTFIALACVTLAVLTGRDRPVRPTAP